MKLIQFVISLILSIEDRCKQIYKLRPSSRFLIDIINSKIKNAMIKILAVFNKFNESRFNGYFAIYYYIASILFVINSEISRCLKIISSEKDF